jgi:hypothetical protein
MREREGGREGVNKLHGGKRRDFSYSHCVSYYDIVQPVLNCICKMKLFFLLDDCARCKFCAS